MLYQGCCQEQIWYRNPQYAFHLPVTGNEGNNHEPTDKRNLVHSYVPAREGSTNPPREGHDLPGTEPLVHHPLLARTHFPRHAVELPDRDSDRHF